MVYILVVYPSQLQSSSVSPPLPVAHTYMLPLPPRPCECLDNARGKMIEMLQAELGIDTGAPNVNFRKISVRKTIWDLEFSEHLL